MTAVDALPRIGVGVIVVRAGRVLLGRRVGSHGEGQWAPPGGRLEPGESVAECARRELAEETGLRLRSIAPGPWNEHRFDDGPGGTSLHYLTIFAVATVAPGEPALLEPDRCAGWTWHSWNALPSPLFAPFAALVTRWTPSPVLAEAASAAHDDEVPQREAAEANPAGGDA